MKRGARAALAGAFALAALATASLPAGDPGSVRARPPAPRRAAAQAQTQSAPAAVPLDDLLQRLQAAFAAKDPSSFAGIFAAPIRERERLAVSTFLDPWKMDRLILHKAGEPVPLDDGWLAYVQVLYQSPTAAILETWKTTLGREDGAWRILTKRVSSGPTTLYKLIIPSDRVRKAALVEVRHEDIVLTFKDAWVFYDNLPDVETGLVILGPGRLEFSPSSEVERHQLELRFKSPRLDDRLTSAYLRFSNSFFERGAIRIEAGPEEPGAPAAVPTPAETARAAAVFRRSYPASFTVRNSLTDELLTFMPQSDQAFFDLQADRAGALAYVYSPFSEEEINLIGRDKDQIINLYTPERPGETARRMFVSLGQKFDVLRCDVDLDFQPDRFYISARARIQVRADIDQVDSLSFEINPSLEIVRVYDQTGRELFTNRDPGRRLLYIYFLEPLAKGAEATVEVYYRGALEPPVQTVDAAAGGQLNETIALVAPHYDSCLYSQSAYWYPAPSDDDFFLARLRLSVPPKYLCVANGDLVGKTVLKSVRSVTALERVGNTLFEFEVRQPLKYLSFVVGRFNPAPNVGAAGEGPPVEAVLDADIRVLRKGLLDDARTALALYSRWFGPYPYEKLTVVQRLWPVAGGHSPASFVILNEIPRLPDTAIIINPNSPVDFSRYREYYVAHEIAHQWWGQAVTWTTYHDQWLSEGLAQFAALSFLREKYGEAASADLLRKCARWAVRKSDWGPITLGSRLSFLDFDAYQAVVYDKSAVVLELLRRLLGDEVFTAGLRSFFAAYKFKAARTANFIRAMEEASGRDLQPFFRTWFQSHLLPDVFVSHAVDKEGAGFVLRLKLHQAKTVFPFPVTVEWREARRVARKTFSVWSQTEELEIRTPVRPTNLVFNADGLVPGRFFE